MMNAVARTWPFRFASPLAASRSTLPASSRRSSRQVVLTALLAFLALNVGLVAAMDFAFPQVRDPEYGRRVVRLQKRLAENPGRPLVVAIGSSRTAMGVRPDVWEATRPKANPNEPLLFNMSLVGSGPLMQNFCLRRLYNDGLAPEAVILEYWPAFLREDGPYWEIDRIDHHRCYPSDTPFIRDFSRDPAAFEKSMRECRMNPFSENRHHLLAQVVPSWLPWHRRIDPAWAGMDGWGWLPGIDEANPPDPTTRRLRVEHCEKVYRKQFEGYSIHPLADRGLRESVALARANGAKVAFAYLPEATEFRGWMPPEVEAACREHLAKLCRELDVPLIDARCWMPDGCLVDGFHLSRVGAAEFSKRFGPAVAAAFPGLERRR